MSNGSLATARLRSASILALVIASSAGWAPSASAQSQGKPEPGAAKPSGKPDEKPGAKDKKDAPAKIFKHADAGVTLAEPDGWRVVPNDSVTVPGEVLRVWTPGNVASIVLFRQQPGQPVNPRDVLDSSVAGLEGMGVKVSEKEVRDIAKMRGMWLVGTGKGTGGALGPNLGETPTSQVWAAVPRESDLIVVLLTAPEKDLANHRKLLEGMLKSMTLTGSQTDAQKQSK